MIKTIEIAPDIMAAYLANKIVYGFSDWYKSLFNGDFYIMDKPATEKALKKYIQEYLNR